jgi:hypothetical protein
MVGDAGIHSTACRQRSVGLSRISSPGVERRYHTRNGKKGDCVRLLATRAARGIILFGSVLVVAAMNLPQVVGVAVIIAIQAGLYWYALSLLHRKY